ncbi:MAG: hypothetical protein IPK57_05405 [Chitinophagaceae bacterium]|nr:hypothetical protein [Chitinophagaceae bacterium]
MIVRLTDSSVKEPLQRYRSQAEAELASVLDWWMQYIPDDEDGFHGEIDRYNKLKADAPRGLVLYSRILWTFSAAYIHTRNREYLLWPKGLTVILSNISGYGQWRHVLVG